MEKFKEIKEKKSEELKKILAEKREILRQFRFDTALKQVKNVARKRLVRKEIAKILTALNQKAREEKE